LQGFPQLLKYILWALSEKEIKIKTKALKALGTVVEADPSVLNERDVYNSVKQRFLDPSIMVREAAIDLVGKFIAGRPDLAAQYYDVISERIHVCFYSTLLACVCSCISCRMPE
jgi:cohesin loading factor subunit SCC2